jgi:hypothetical protein
MKLSVKVLGVILMAIVSVIAASQLSSLITKPGGNVSSSEGQPLMSTDNLRELSFDEEFTIKDPLTSSGVPGGQNFTSSIPASYNYMQTPGMSSSADSIIYENDSVFTIETYKDELSTEGEWISVTPAEIDPEGVTTSDGGFDSEINTQYVWRPRNVSPDWSPYTNGYWSYTNCGWMWVSYYSWGWRPYHYGRWWWSSYYGWVWSPGFVWAPAWVVWMYNDGYCGWYPISPRVRWHYDHGYRCHYMRYRVRHWNFCNKRDFANPLNPPIVIVDPMYNGGIIKTSKYDGEISLTNVGIKTGGPNVNDVEQAGGKTITKKDVTKYNNARVDKNPTKKVNDENTRINNKRKTATDDVNTPPNTRTDGGEKINREKETNPNNERRYEEPKQKQPEKKYEQPKQKQPEKKYEAPKQKQPEKKYEAPKKEEKRQPEKKNEAPKKEERKQPEQKYEAPKQYNPPPKQDISPPKQYNPPPKNESPPKQYTPPPKQESPPKNDPPPSKDDGGKKDNSKGR